MTDRQNHPDNTGAQWNGASSNAWAVPERPAYLNRTEPMGQQHRENEPMTGQSAAAHLPSQHDSAPQWPADAGAAPIDPEAASVGDPELAAAAGIDTSGATHSPVPPTPPPAQLPHEPPRVPAAQPAPPAHSPTTPPPAAHPGNESPSGIHQPTQVHNPVTRPPDRGRTYPSQVAERSGARGLAGVIVIVGTVTAVLLVGYMLVRTLAAGAFDPASLLSGGLALIGLPLTGIGLHAVLGQPAPDGPAVLFRAPYTQLISGLILLMAAGMAA